MEFFLFATIAAVVVLFIQVSGLKRVNRSVLKRLRELEEDGKPVSTAKLLQSKTTTPTPVQKSVIEDKTKSVEDKKVQERPPVSALTSKPPKQKSEFWTKLERQVAENWTGILGSVIMVVGVGFLGIYAALKLEAFFRFIMISGFSALLFATYFFLRKLEKWVQLGLWLRSSAAAIFLFACIGSGAIPGLQWIYDPMFALILLLVGISVNLALSWLDKNEVFSSLHVILSLVALSLAPQGMTTIILATTIALVGIVRTYRVQWEYQLLSSLSAFFVYHIYWYLIIKSDASLPNNLTFAGIIGVVLVGISSAVVHYREVYQTKGFSKFPFIVHMINWAFLTVGLMMHSTGSQWKTVPLALAAIGAYLLAKRARKLGIGWLYRTDTLISLATALFAAVSLTKWGMDIQVILGITFIEILVFMLLMYTEGEHRLYKAGYYLLNLISIILLLNTLFLATIDLDPGMRIQSATVLFVILVLALIAHIFMIRKSSKTFDLRDNLADLIPKQKISFIAIQTGFYPIVIYTILYQLFWAQIAVAAVVVGLLYLRQTYQSRGLIAAVVFSLFGTLALSWLKILHFQSFAIQDMLLNAVPFIIPAVTALLWDRVDAMGKHIKWPGIYLTTIQVHLILFYVLEHISPLIFGVMLLLSTVILFELSMFLSKRFEKSLEHIGTPDRYLLHMAYAALFIFMVRHIYVHLQVEEYIGLFKLRLLIELLAIGVIGYCAFMIRPPSILKYKSWVKLHPLLVELVIIFSAFTVALEIDTFWHPVIWIAVAFLLPLLSTTLGEKFSRLKFYGVIFYWICAFQVAFLSSAYVTPSLSWQDQSWFSGLIAIVFMFGYLVVFYKKYDLEKITFPSTLSLFDRLSKKTARYQNPIFMYPLVFSVAVFLYWSFDKSALTLFWVVECLAVFILSIVLKEQHFRHVALGALAICIVRLVFFDLSQTGTLTKALVFLGVGVIMLLMNTLYKKYKDRMLDE